MNFLGIKIWATITHVQFTITSRSQKIYYQVKIFDWNACTNKMETRFLETKISLWNFKLDCYSICGQNLDKHGKNGIFHDKFMNTKWTLNELKMNWTRPKIWATITHVRELKISQNMSQIHELNWTERKWSAISFIFSHLCRQF